MWCTNPVPGPSTSYRCTSCMWHRWWLRTRRSRCLRGSRRSRRPLRPLWCLSTCRVCTACRRLRPRSRSSPGCIERTRRRNWRRWPRRHCLRGTRCISVAWRPRSWWRRCRPGTRRTMLWRGPAPSSTSQAGTGGRCWSLSLPWQWSSCRRGSRCTWFRMSLLARRSTCLPSSARRTRTSRRPPWMSTSLRRT